MVDFGETVSSIVPTKASIVSGFGGSLLYITIFILVVVFLIIGGIIVWAVVRSLQYNKKIVLFEDRNGYIEEIGTDRAKEIIYNSFGDSCFYLKKRKRYLPRGEIKVRKNKFYYVIGQDGEWVNVGLESIDRKLKTMGVKPIHPDMRAFKSGMVKIIRDRFEKRSSLKEWLPIVLPIALFIIVGLVMYFIADRLVVFLDKLPTVIDSLNKVLDREDAILSKLNNLMASGVKV